MAGGHGGHREGAGRPVGVVAKPKRYKTMRNEALLMRARFDKMPLEHMLTILNTELDPKTHTPEQLAHWEHRQDEAAKHAAPFLHQKLAQVEIIDGGGAEEQPLTIDTSKLTTEEIITLRALLVKSQPVIPTTIDSEDYSVTENPDVDR